MTKLIERESPVLTVLGLADYLRVHPSTVYRLVYARAIPCFKLGSDYRFDRRKIDEWTKGKTMEVR